MSVTHIYHNFWLGYHSLFSRYFFLEHFAFRLAVNQVMINLRVGYEIIISWDFPGGAVVKNPPANAGDTGSIPGPGRLHMPRSN